MGHAPARGLRLGDRALQIPAGDQTGNPLGRRQGPVGGLPIDLGIPMVGGGPVVLPIGDLAARGEAPIAVKRCGGDQRLGLFQPAQMDVGMGQQRLDHGPLGVTGQSGISSPQLQTAGDLLPIAEGIGLGGDGLIAVGVQGPGHKPIGGGGLVQRGQGAGAQMPRRIAGLAPLQVECEHRAEQLCSRQEVAAIE